MSTAVEPRPKAVKYVKYGKTNAETAPRPAIAAAEAATQAIRGGSESERF